MAFYELYHTDDKNKDYILNLFPRSKELSPDNQKLLADAFYTVWKNTGFEKLEDVPFSDDADWYHLVDHINEVADMCMKMAEFAGDKWNDHFTDQIDREELLMLALLHDLDKVMLHDKGQKEKGLHGAISHGYLSGLILNDLGADQRLISLVAYHSPAACMSVYDPLAMILHYADLFSADHIYMIKDKKPYYFD